MKHVLSFFTAAVLLGAQSLPAQWIQTGLTSTRVLSLTVNDSNLFAGTSSAGVFFSNNNGASWSAVNTGLRTLNVTALAVSGSYVFAGIAHDGVFRSANNGTSWVKRSQGLSGTGTVWSFAVNGPNLFAGTFDSGVFLSTNDGTSWTAVNAGLGDLDVRSLVVSGSHLFAGTYNAGVWRRPLSELVTAVADDFGQVPVGFTLEQNYPNPFNPNTEIRYTIAQPELVKLTVFTALGEEVARLVNAKQAAGEYRMQWTPQNLPSGVYLCRLQAGAFSQTKKMILLR